ncbi:hypothetical protein ETG59_07370 [Proteus mirabilis]|uniref:hypothetical protein n=1 Tax=Proteus mirabilis TaxID=584 RepID=UPI0019D11563|nr:hypothetical protein [Proteus mirabilis]MBI6486118.1 hypothetical protein [Proteus mirabilis]MBN7150359.1 hypothetical protein [Proteus mirabilis]MBN7154226.1 hypothetical protein [Proteus mirabilis]MBN7166989.1 hypothetical protein [Proteus mirabilis]MBN7169768.1 hypothetical protein [Proteus mirabilis]
MLGFNRVLQLRILEVAVQDYPNTIQPENIPTDLSDIDNDILLKNIAYLSEEEMITGGVIDVMAGAFPELTLVKATRHAVNLLTEEGSISTSLKVITVRLHDETLNEIRDFITLNVPDPEERKGYLQRLKELPADATKHIVLQLLGKGLNQIPDAVQWLQTVLRS